MRNPDGMVVVDHHGLILFANPAAEHLLGRRLGPLLGQEFGYPVVDGELTEVDIPETEAVAEMRVVALDWEGAPALLASLRDVTERKRMERELERAAVERRVAAKARDLHRVTEAALAHMRLEQLLPELLARIAKILGVDNAAVLLSDEHDDLVLHAAYGLEAEAIGFRVPIGEGFAGRVAAERRILALAGAEVSTVRNPLLRRLRAVLGVPLIVGNRVVGVLHVGSLGERSFAADERELLQLAADRAALAIEHARIYDRTRATAEVLQKSLLPEHLPEIPGLELAACYVPAGEGYQVGGDFYDVFQVGPSRWLVVLGDVCGKGPEAAALTALVRYTLRAEALHEPRPTELLGLLNDAILLQRSDLRFCTAICATLDMRDGAAELTVAAGGHPLPFVLRRSGDIRTIGRTGTLIGVLPDADFRAETVELGAGDTVVLYTDGVLEAHAPQRILEPLDLARLLASIAGLGPQDLVRRIESEMGGSRGAPARDDIAILALRLR